MDIIAMNGSSWFLFLVSAIIAALVIVKSKAPIWSVVPVTLVLWLGFWIVLSVLKVVWALLPLLILVGIALVIFHFYGKSKEEKKKEKS